MRVAISNDISADKWDEQVTGCGGNYFHTHAFAVYEVNKSNIAPLFISLLAKNGDVSGVAIVHIEKPKHWPFSKYCKKAILGALPKTLIPDDLLPFMRLIEDELVKLGVFSVFNHAYESRNSKDILSRLGYTLNERSEFYISLAGNTDAVWNNFESSRRRNIRKAEKNDVVSKIEKSLAATLELKNLQANALDRKDIKVANLDSAAKAIVTDLLQPQRAWICTSYKDGAAVSSSLISYFNGKAYYISSGSSMEGNKVCGPAHMVWCAIKQLKSMGYTEFNLGGVSMEEANEQTGLFSYKKKFGAEIVNQPSGQKILSSVGNLLNKAKGFFVTIKSN